MWALQRSTYRRALAPRPALLPVAADVVHQCRRARSWQSGAVWQQAELAGAQMCDVKRPWPPCSLSLQLCIPWASVCNSPQLHTAMGGFQLEASGGWGGPGRPAPLLYALRGAWTRSQAGLARLVPLLSCPAAPHPAGLQVRHLRRSAHRPDRRGGAEPGHAAADHQEREWAGCWPRPCGEALLLQPSPPFLPSTPPPRAALLRDLPAQRRDGREDPGGEEGRAAAASDGRHTRRRSCAARCMPCADPDRRPKPHLQCSS